jgi:uncharacterized protein (TIGR00730 family)
MNICVFCGSSTGVNPVFGKITSSFGKVLAVNKCHLIYGGGKLGLMGILAQSVLDNGGLVTGVIPDFMINKEVAHEGITKLIITESMHMRKAEMARLSDGFVVLPGGLGTLDEMAEILTWNQLGIIQKPVVLFNPEGYYDTFLKMISVMEHNGFLRQNGALHTVTTIDAIIPAIENFHAPGTNIWDHTNKT